MPQPSSPRLLFRSIPGGATPTRKLEGGSLSLCSRRRIHAWDSVRVYLQAVQRGLRSLGDQVAVLRVKAD